MVGVINVSLDRPDQLPIPQSAHISLLLSILDTQAKAWPRGGTPSMFLTALTEFTRYPATALPLPRDHRRHCSPCTAQGPAFSNAQHVLTTSPETKRNWRMLNKGKMLSVEGKALKSGDPFLPYLKFEFISSSHESLLFLLSDPTATRTPRVPMTRSQEQSFSQDSKEERI